MSATFIYTNDAADFVEFESEIRAFDQAGMVLDLGRAWWEQSGPMVAALDRPELRRMLQRVRAGDTIVTLRLSSVGRNVNDVLATIDRLRALGVHLRCMELGDCDLTAADTEASLALRAISRLERQSRSTRMKESAAMAAGLGRRLGRRPSVEANSHVVIREALQRGTSVSELARRFSVSRQTIMRIRDAGDRR